MKDLSYQEAVAYIESFIGKVIYKVRDTKEDPLERMRVLLTLLDHPEKKFRSILIGGTSGKGSVSFMLASILTQAHYKTGLMIKPHVQKINERMQINMQEVSNDMFVSLAKEVMPAISQMGKMPIGVPSYFEILTAMAFCYFAKEAVDIAVVEVGMGGEFDATNTLDPFLAILTNVSLDHTEILGKTVQKIAKTKAGIIKSLPNKKPQVVITGVKQPSVIAIVEKRCIAVGAKLYRLDNDFSFVIKVEKETGSLFDFETNRYTLSDLNLSLLGKHQVENASLVLQTVVMLEQFGFLIKEETMRKTLQQLQFMGRFEIITLGGPVNFFPHSTSSQTPFTAGAQWGSPKLATPSKENASLSIILDGAHNAAKMKAFLGTMKKFYKTKKKLFIVAFKDDKDIKNMIRNITQTADMTFITQFQSATDLAYSSSFPQRIASFVQNKKFMIEPDPFAALQKAIDTARKQDALIAVTGSLYLVGEIRQYIFSNLLKAA